MMRRGISTIALLIVIADLASAGGMIRGTTGGIERGANVYAPDGVIGNAITGWDSRYEFHDIPPGRYIMEVNGRIVPGVAVREGETTVVDYAGQPQMELEKEMWAPAYTSVAQSFRALGSGVNGISFWMAGGNAFMDVSLYEGDGPGGERIAGPHRSENPCTWITGVSLPSDRFKTEPGKTYTIEIKSVDGSTWSMGMPRPPDPYEDGIAYFDGVPHPESDIGITISEDVGGFTEIAAARDDLHYIEEGPGSGSCRVAGQTFVANIPYLIGAYANCGWGGGVGDFIFSIHEDGPGGKQVGPAKRVTMVSNWGTTAIWAPGEIALEIGKTYFFQYKRENNESFFSYLSSDRYSKGIAYRDGKPMADFDQLFHIYGEIESESFTFPYNIEVTAVGATFAEIEWETGTLSDGVVLYNAVGGAQMKAGDEDERTLSHRVRLEVLEPAALYRFIPTSHTHKTGSRRTHGAGGDFMTLFDGRDEPRFQNPTPRPEPPALCAECVAIHDGDFEDRRLGWKVVSATAAVGEHGAIGSLTSGIDGYEPHTGEQMYGWAHVNYQINAQTAANEWNYEIISQTVAVEPGAEYELRAWALTGNRESGWGADSRVRLVVDLNNAGLLDAIETADQALATQWFATRSKWLPIFLRFKTKSDRVTIGVQFLQWWAKAADYLYADDVSLRKLDHED